MRPRQPPKRANNPLVSVTTFYGKSASPYDKASYYPFDYQWIYWMYSDVYVNPDPSTAIIDRHICTPVSVHARFLVHYGDLVANSETFSHLDNVHYTNYDAFQIHKVVFDINITSRLYDRQGTFCFGFEPNQNVDHSMDIVNIRPGWSIDWLPMLDTNYIINRYRWRVHGSVNKTHRLVFVPEANTPVYYPHLSETEFGIITMHYMSYGQHTHFSNSMFSVVITATTYFTPVGYRDNAHVMRSSVKDCYRETLGPYGFNTIGIITNPSQGDWFLGKFLEDGRIESAGSGRVAASGFAYKYYDGEINLPNGGKRSDGVVGSRKRGLKRVVKMRRHDNAA